MVENGQGGEVLPRETSLVGWARADIRREQRPSPALRDAGLEPDGHGEEAVELAEDHLLAGLGGDGLEEELGGLAGVEVFDEAVDARLAEASQPLAEVDELADGGVGVVVSALHGCLSTQDVAEQGRVANFLVGHELDQESVRGGEAGGFEVGDGEAGESVVEEVEFDPLLVESHGLDARQHLGSAVGRGEDAYK